MATPVLIAGPTASGKSRLALEFARRSGGVVINADAMQVYAELRILSSRPSDAELEAAPHRLFGHVPAAEAYSVGRWTRDIARVLAEARKANLRPIIVGGTGLYFRALTSGLARVPDVPPSIRTAWRERAATLSTPDLHQMLSERSASEARRLRPSDRSRILRALEVIDATGRTLPEWQDEAAGSALIDPEESIKIVLTPPRVELYERIDRRFLAMMELGALSEARKIAAMNLNPELPAMKSIGLTALLANLSGEITIDEAIARAQTETRNYAKRQMTWFRNQMPEWQQLTLDEALATAVE
jgi:tRNA dimethylallyltransferase